MWQLHALLALDLARERQLEAARAARTRRALGDRSRSRSWLRGLTTLLTGGSSARPSSPGLDRNPVDRLAEGRAAR